MLDDRINDKPEARPAVRILKTTLKFIISQWLLIGIGVVCLLAYFFPNVAKHGGVIRSEYTILYGAVAIIFLVSGLSIPRQKLFSHALNWRLHTLVQGTSFLIFPVLVVAVVHAIIAGDPYQHIDRAALAGFILTACIPTTIASNVVMTRSAGGDEAAALVEVVIANILGPFLTAGWTVTLMPTTKEFEPWRQGGGDLSAMYKNVFKQLGLSALLPLIIGQLIRWTWPNRTAWVLQTLYISKISIVCLLLLVWTTFSSAFATNALEALSTASIVFTVLFNVAFYLVMSIICFIVSRPPQVLNCHPWGQHIFRQMPHEETIAVCFCGPAKTTALGIPLLYTMWPAVDLFTKAKTSIPVLLYTTEQICVAQFIVFTFRHWLRRSRSRRSTDTNPDDLEMCPRTVIINPAAEPNSSNVDPVTGLALDCATSDRERKWSSGDETIP